MGTSTEVAAEDLKVVVDRFHAEGGALRGEPPAALLGAYLTAAQRARLTAALGSTETTSKGDRDLFSIVRAWDEKSATEWLVRRLRTAGSGASHEIDVSLCKRSVGEAVRQHRGALPNTRGLLGAIECKFYDSQLGTALGREFVGLLDDCGVLVIKIFITNGQNAPLAAYLSRKARPQPFFAVSTLVGASRDRFVSVVEQALRQWARVP